MGGSPVSDEMHHSNSALGHVDVIRDPEVVNFLSSCQYRVDISACSDAIETRLLDVSERVSELNSGAILATDGTLYESVVEKQFPTVRVGLIKVATVFLDLASYQESRAEARMFVDPIEIADIRRKSQAFSVVLPGAGVLHPNFPDSRAFFRDTVFRLFCRDGLSSNGYSFYDTLVEMMSRMRMVGEFGGVRCVTFPKGTKSPVDNQKLARDIHIPVEIGFIDGPGGRMYVTDRLRVHEAFSAEGSNRECFNRLLLVLKHLYMAHVIRILGMSDSFPADDLIVLMNGQLAVFGEPARFHEGIMGILHDARESASRRGKVGPTVVGLSKSGKVFEHAKAIEPYLVGSGGGARDGTWLLPVDDEYRDTVVQPAWEPRERNFGDETYYGQNFVLRTRKGKVFDACLAYPFRDKAPRGSFRERKVDVRLYGQTLDRMLSCIDLLQMDLFGNAVSPVYLAEKYASIAHAPGGRTLDQFVREALRRIT